MRAAPSVSAQIQGWPRRNWVPMEKQRLPLKDILRDVLRQIDECCDPRKNEPTAISLRKYLERKISESSDELSIAVHTYTKEPPVAVI